MFVKKLVFDIVVLLVGAALLGGCATYRPMNHHINLPEAPKVWNAHAYLSIPKGRSVEPAVGINASVSIIEELGFMADFNLGEEGGIAAAFAIANAQRWGFVKLETAIGGSYEAQQSPELASVYAQTGLFFSTRLIEFGYSLRFRNFHTISSDPLEHGNQGLLFERGFMLAVGIDSLKIVGWLGWCDLLSDQVAGLNWEESAYLTMGLQF